MAMPAGALIAGPLGTAIGISSAQYAAAAAIVAASMLALIPRDIRTMRSGGPALPPVPEEPTEPTELTELTELTDPAAGLEADVTAVA
jgi:hypothetical protein